MRRAFEGQRADAMAPLFALSPSGVTSLVALARDGLRVALLDEQTRVGGPPDKRASYAFWPVNALDHL